jgi:hypothetical protein
MVAATSDVYGMVAGVADADPDVSSAAASEGAVSCGGGAHEGTGVGSELGGVAGV